MNVSLMVTCLGDVLFPHVGMATVALLTPLGVKVDFPRPKRAAASRTSTAATTTTPGRSLGTPSETFSGSHKVVTPSGSCAAMVKLEYLELFHDDPVWHPRAVDLASRTHELSDFIVNVLGIDDVGARFAAKVTYHMACHLRGLGLTETPLRLLRKVHDLELVPLERGSVLRLWRLFFGPLSRHQRGHGR